MNTNANAGCLSSVNMGYDAFSGNQVAFEVDYASGQQGIYVATLGGNRCPLSQGYWKSHQSVWPETSLTLGSQNYTAAELLAILNTPSNRDASLVLARQLIAAKLNIFNGSNSAPASAAIADADGLLAGFGGKLPYGVKSTSATGQTMLSDATTLDQRFALSWLSRRRQRPHTMTRQSPVCPSAVQALTCTAHDPAASLLRFLIVEPTVQYGHFYGSAAHDHKQRNEPKPQRTNP